METSLYLIIPIVVIALIFDFTVITGAISGMGAVQRLFAVRWGVTARIVWAWIFTIPASAIIALIVYSFIRLIL